MTTATTMMTTDESPSCHLVHQLSQTQSDSQMGGAGTPRHCSIIPPARFPTHHNYHSAALGPSLRCRPQRRPRSSRGVRSTRRVFPHPAHYPMLTTGKTPSPVRAPALHLQLLVADAQLQAPSGFDPPDMRNDPRAPQSFGRDSSANGVIRQSQAILPLSIHIVDTVHHSSTSTSLWFQWFGSKPPTRTGSPTIPITAQSTHGCVDGNPSWGVSRFFFGAISVHSGHW